MIHLTKIEKKNLSLYRVYFYFVRTFIDVWPNFFWFTKVLKDVVKLYKRKS
jgi:hypothetical protein